MNSNIINHFINLIKNNPLVIDENQALKIQNSVRDEFAKPLMRCFSSSVTFWIINCFLWILFIIPFAVTVISIFVYFVEGLTLRSDRINFLMFNYSVFIFGCLYILSIFFLYQKEKKMNFIISSLNPVSANDRQACEMAVDLCQVVPEAELMRLRLVEQGRPVRFMHLEAMKSMDTHKAVERMRAQRLAEAQSKADQERRDECFRLHGLAP